MLIGGAALIVFSGCAFQAGPVSAVLGAAEIEGEGCRVRGGPLSPPFAETLGSVAGSVASAIPGASPPPDVNVTVQSTPDGIQSGDRVTLDRVE